MSPRVNRKSRPQDSRRGTPTQKDDRRDAELILKLVVEKRFPAI